MDLGGCREGLVCLVSGFGILLEDFFCTSHWVWKEIAFSYQLPMVVETVSMDIMQCMREEGIPVEKYPIRTF